MWMALSGNGIWNRLQQAKYIHKLSLSDWVIKGEHSVVKTSLIWNGFLRLFGWISKTLSWKVGDGKYVKVGIDPVVGMEETYCLSWSLVSYLQDYGINTLN